MTIKKIFHLSFFIFYLSFISYAQQPSQITRQEYIQKFKDIAILEMITYKIPASIIMAQALFESDNGNSPLAVNANNHFGIKCHKEWTGKTYLYDDDLKNECFRKYDDPLDSYRDHSEFLISRDRYDSLFFLDMTDYKGWAYGLKRAGYATSPTYAQQLIKIIEDNRLYELDNYFDKEYEEEITVLEKKKIDVGREIILPDNFEAVARGPNGRMIYTNNGVKFTFARGTDTFFKIANDFTIPVSRLFKMNELTPDDKLHEGEPVYLQKKKKHAKKGFHTVAAGETLHAIAQEYAVRIKSLYKINGMEKGQEPTTGQKIIIDQ
ncbi:MAG: glucosaminidase domain-containing protein [Bacteroidetes bacterium]|nr:glucosaminidase domain-containing protein [Bacteroidota bacterium]